LCSDNRAPWIAASNSIAKWFQMSQLGRNQQRQSREWKGIAINIATLPELLWK